VVKKLNKIQKLTSIITEHGISIWVGLGKDRQWIIDASTIFVDNTFSFNPSRFKVLTNRKTCREFKLIK
jgi:hypothetical protein